MFPCTGNKSHIITTTLGTGKTIGCEKEYNGCNGKTVASDIWLLPHSLLIQWYAFTKLLNWICKLYVSLYFRMELTSVLLVT